VQACTPPALYALHLRAGWHRDGPVHRVDHINGFACHTFGLPLHHFAPQFAQWFDPTGRGPAFGRSMTCSVGMVVFCAAYLLAAPDPALPFPWGGD
jgi:hypothetical protein